VCQCVTGFQKKSAAMPMVLSLLCSSLLKGRSMGEQQAECRLTDEERARCKLPNRGTWFWRQEPMLELYHAEKGFAVAFDNLNSKGAGKIYGVYKDVGEFYYCLLESPVNQRWGYELIPVESPCKAYADIEWVGPAEPEHTTLRAIVGSIRAKAWEELGIRAEIYVCCGSRPTKAGADGAAEGDPSFKHSYHIVVENLVFEQNHDGQMKEFFTMEEEWWWKHKGQRVVDLCVYTKNRVFRLPLCCKQGMSVPLVRISGDPLEDEFDHSYAEGDVKAVLPFVLTNPAVNGDVLVVPCREAPAGRPKAVRVSKPASVSKQMPPACAPDSHPLPFPPSLLEEILVEAGDSVSRVTRVAYHPERTEWQVQCVKHGVPRPCLLDPLRHHSSNNCLLFVKQKPEGLQVKCSMLSLKPSVRTT
jgi:hypothetical protein